MAACRCLLAALSLLALGPGAGAQTVIEGTVRLPPPASVAPAVSRYAPKTTEPVGPPDPPAAIVYLEAPAGTNATAVAQLGQQHFQFKTGLLAIQKGTAVEFPNFDDAYHNVFSYSKAKRFDLGRYRKDEKPARQVFDQPGVVKLYCEIHEHMHSTILVLDTPYFMKTDARDHYRLELKGLPPGRYTLKAWLDEKTIWERAVEIKIDQTQQADFPGK